MNIEEQEYKISAELDELLTNLTFAQKMVRLTTDDIGSVWRARGKYVQESDFMNLKFLEQVMYQPESQFMKKLSDWKFNATLL